MMSKVFSAGTAAQQRTKADGMYFCPAFANAMLYAGPSSWWRVGKNAHVSNQMQQ